MKKDAITSLFKNVQTTATKHSGEILLGIGIATSITTTIMAVKATPKALDIIREHDEAGEDVPPMTKKEIVKATYKVYIPTVAMGTVSIICLVASGSVNARRQAAIMTAATISETALREYQEKVIEVIGEEKEKEVRDAVAAEQIRKNPISEKEVIITSGKTLCFDVPSGRYFESDVDRIKRAENELNRQMIQDGYVALNDLYFLLGLKAIGLGDDLGWNVDRGLIDIYFSSQLTEEGKPCVVIGHRLPPTYDYKL